MLLVLMASVIGSFGAVFLKLGSAKINRSILSFANPQLVLGVGLFLGSSVFYAMGIKGGQLSVLYPMAPITCIASSAAWNPARLAASLATDVS
jgi:hypothetical protein